MGRGQTIKAQSGVVVKVTVPDTGLVVHSRAIR